MSEIHIRSVGTPDVTPADYAPPGPRSAETRPSFLEKFINSFFQDKNIKWMLIIGAAIVFGSSLMLVTKNWPSWPNTLKFFTILGYTGAVFEAAEVSRKRLGLQSTYKVLHSLTLLLLPVCFLALRWLTSGTATQVTNAVEFCGLLLPTTAFLWFAAGRILDHLLRGRQTTFLLSYSLLCVAGALPPATTAVGAFALMATGWLIMTAGVMKVNRHTFWLAEEHQLPRIFGFVPIAMLGLQFAVLVGTKAITAIPLQWTGFGVVMVAATILMTARTVADVFRQRTGDLVRPLPWNIAVPMFCGLVLTALGVTLSLNGFSYVSETTYAVIPTAVVAAGLMFVAAKDARHAGFVWAGLICTTVAYQCCPVLFADIVNALKQSTAEAIRRERVPLSLYGVTYLPLLSVLAGVSHWFLKKSDTRLSRPLKHFAVLLASLLFCFALTDVVSRFFVSVANVGAFLLFAIAFRDRRCALPSIVALVLAVAFAIPALNDMGHQISTEWIPTALATLAVAMTATRLPDRIVNTIPLTGASLLRHRDSATGQLTLRSLLMQTRDGQSRNVIQLTGCVLAFVMSTHWIGHSIVNFPILFSQASLLQFCLLMTAFAVYTLRNPHYLSGFAFWGLTAWAGLHWAMGHQHMNAEDLLNVASYAAIGGSVMCYLWLKLTGQMSQTNSLRDLRCQLGFDSTVLASGCVFEPTSTGGRTRQTQAFVVPLCDLSLVLLSCLVAPVHFLRLAGIHLALLSDPTAAVGLLLPSTVVTVLWLVAATSVFRNRVTAVAATIALPLTATAAAASAGLPIAASWCPVVWAVVEGVLYIVSSRQYRRDQDTMSAPAIARISESWLQGLLLLSCLSFDAPIRGAAIVCLAAFLSVDGRRLTPSRRTYFAIMGNVQLLLLAAGIGGCSGFVPAVLAGAGSAAAVPLIFFVAAASVLLFDRYAARPGHSETDSIPAASGAEFAAPADPVVCLGWTALLRAMLIILAAISLSLPTQSAGLIALMTAGFVLAAATEIRHAIRIQAEAQVWSACVAAAIAALFLVDQGVIQMGAGISQFVLLGISTFGLTTAWKVKRSETFSIIHRPMSVIGQTLPALVTVMAIGREFTDSIPSMSALNALALMTAAGIYFQQAVVTRKRRFAAMAAVIMNAGLMLLWRSLEWTEPEFYLVPAGLSVLGFVELLKNELPRKSHDPLRYIGALTILVSPVFEVLGGSWGHMFALMVLSVLVILAAIGLRIRVLVYTGSAFLLADLAAMVIRSTVDHPSLLWLCGVGVGAAVIALAAFCENHREKLLARIRYVSAELATWN